MLNINIDKVLKEKDIADNADKVFALVGTTMFIGEFHTISSAEITMTLALVRKKAWFMRLYTNVCL